MAEIEGLEAIGSAERVLRAPWWSAVNAQLASWGEAEATFFEVRPVAGMDSYHAAERISSVRREARLAARGPIQDRLTVAVADVLDGRKRRPEDAVLVSAIAEANALITDLVAGIERLHATLDEAHPKHEDMLDREVCDAADEERHPDYPGLKLKAFERAAALVARAKGEGAKP